MRRWFLIFLAIFLFAGSATNAVVEHKNPSPYKCVIEKVFKRDLPKDKILLYFDLDCNSPYGFRAYMTDPLSGAPYKDIISGDGPIKQKVYITITKHEFNRYNLKVIPALN